MFKFAWVIGLYAMATSGDTHPVYIAKDRKTRVKTVAAQEGVSMKDVTERFAEHGDQLRLFEIPVDADDEEVYEHVREQLPDADE